MHSSTNSSCFPHPSRRGFLAAAAASVAAFTTGTPFLQGQTATQTAPRTTPPSVPSASSTAMTPPFSRASTDRNTINLIGPKQGYTPQIGTLVTMLTWMELAVLGTVRKLTPADLDFLFDKNANSIGALLLHLAATEVYYQRHTFLGEKWDGWPADVKAKWDPAMELGDAGRASIKGHDVTFYVDALRDARATTLAELARRDDNWLSTVDKDWPWGPTNNYCKWFHVCEHISHHAGQIDLLMKRLPSYKPES